MGMGQLRLDEGFLPRKTGCSRTFKCSETMLRLMLVTAFAPLQVTSISQARLTERGERSKMAPERV